MTALMMTACSQDDLLSFKQDAISYSVTAGKHTRAADSYCNNDLPKSFKVWAQTGEGNLFINGDVIEKQGEDWVDVAGTRYWADNKTLDFFAEVNGDKEFNLNGGAPTFNDFTVADDVTKQVDLIYAVRKNQTKSNDKVELNFRHALSQVCFRAKNNMKNVEVTIGGVSVGHLTTTGSFAFPTEDTDVNYTHPSHGDEVDPNAPALNGGTWTYPENATYTKQYDVVPTAGNVTIARSNADGIVNLTCPTDDHAKGFAQVLTLLPQEVNAWDPSIKGEDYNGAYFLVDVVLTNVVENGEDAVKTELYKGKAAIPVDIDWEQGYRYIYTFVFDEGGNGGYTPDPNDPKPVLTSIKYDVTVDDFIPVYPDGGNTPDGGTIMDGDESAYTYTTTLNLHDGDQVTQVKIGSNDETFSYTLPEEYYPTATAEFWGWAWDTNNNAQTKKVVKGSPIEVDMTKESTDLYAVWTFTWAYDLMGGHEPEAGQTYFNGAKVYRTHGGNFSFVNRQPVKDGYTFKGWALSEDGEVAYQPGDKAPFDKNEPNRKFYAVWDRNTVSITLDFNGNHTYAENIEGMPASITKTVNEGESASFAIPASLPELEAWEFKGWAESAEGAVKYAAGATLTTSSDMTLYAKWEKKTTSGDLGQGGTDYSNRK